MYLSLLQIIKQDKQVDHPILGQLSCKGLQTAYKNCMNFIDNDSNQQKQCRPYYELSAQCFGTQNNEAFAKLIEDKVQERKRLVNFLRQNQSKLPELQQQNSQQLFNLFTHIDNEQQDSKEIQNFYQKQQQENKKYL